MLSVNMLCWYYGWKKISETKKEWIPILVSVVAYTVTIDMVYNFKEMLFEKGALSTWIVSLFLFCIYVFIAYRAYKSNEIAKQDINLTQ